jgi:hypothetical protein
MITALSSLVNEVTFSITDAMTEGTGWTGDQFAHAALMLLDSSEHGVVQYLVMSEKLGETFFSEYETKYKRDKAGRQVIDALVKANLFALRPPSRLASDIPVSAFQNDGKRGSVITAASTTHFYCMSLYKSKLQALACIRQQQKVCQS